MAKHSNIPYDNLKRAVAAGIDPIYSELTAGGHRSGWMIAWHHPHIADWAFSKVKPSPTHTLSPRAAKRDPGRARLFFGDVVSLSGAGERLFTPDGRRTSVTGLAAASGPSCDPVRGIVATSVALDIRAPIKIRIAARLSLRHLQG